MAAGSASSTPAAVRIRPTGSASRPPVAAPSRTGPGTSGSPGVCRRSRGGSGSPRRLTSARPAPVWTKLAYLSVIGVAYWRVGFGQQLRGGRSCRVSGGSRSSAATASPSPGPTARYAQASNADMLDAALDGLVARFGLPGRAARRGGRRRGAQALAATSTSPARRARLAARPAHPGLRRAAGLRHRAGGGRSWSPTRSPSGRSRPASPAASTPPRTRRSPSTRTCAAAAAPSSTRARTLGERLRRCREAAPAAAVKPEIPRNAEPRTGLSMGEHAARDGAALEHRPRRLRTSWRSRSHQRLAAAYDRGFFDDLMTPYLGLTRDQNLRPDTSAGEARHAQAGLRHEGPDAERPP